MPSIATPTSHRITADEVPAGAIVRTTAVGRATQARHVGNYRWLSRRDVIVGVVGGVVSTVTNWFTPPPPQRQAVELSGGTHHRVDAGSVKWAFDVPQATVTVVRAKAPAASWV